MARLPTGHEDHSTSPSTEKERQRLVRKRKGLAGQTMKKELQKSAGLPTVQSGTWLGCGLGTRCIWSLAENRTGSKQAWS